MKTFARLLALLTVCFPFPADAEELSTKDGIKTGAETIVNGAALVGILGATSQNNSDQTRIQPSGPPKTWGELGAMHKARPGVAEFGK